jgi:hypothetical protein
MRIRLSLVLTGGLVAGDIAKDHQRTSTKMEILVFERAGVGPGDPSCSHDGREREVLLGCAEASTIQVIDPVVSAPWSRGGSARLNRLRDRGQLLEPSLLLRGGAT